MRDTSLADWLAEDDEDLPPGLRADLDEAVPPPASPRRRRPSRRLWLVAAVAWTLVATLAVATWAGGDDGAGPWEDATATGLPDGAPEVPLRDGLPGAGPPAQAPVAATAPAERVPTGGSGRAWTAEDISVATTAALTVRLAHTSHDAATGSSRYVDLAVPSAIDWIGDLAIVTVDAVVLDGDSQGWGEPRPVRYAQPVRRGEAGPVPAGRAWILEPPPSRAPVAPAGTGGGTGGLEPVTETAVVEYARDALAEAGYGEISVEQVARARAWPGVLVVTAAAMAPGEPAPAAHEVWVAEDGAGLLGTARSDSTNPSREGEP